MLTLSAARGVSRCDPPPVSRNARGWRADLGHTREVTRSSARLLRTRRRRSCRHKQAPDRLRATCFGGVLATGCSTSRAKLAGRASARLLRLRRAKARPTVCGRFSSLDRECPCIQFPVARACSGALTVSLSSQWALSRSARASATSRRPRPSRSQRCQLKRRPPRVRSPATTCVHRLRSCPPTNSRAARPRRPATPRRASTSSSSSRTSASSRADRTAAGSRRSTSSASRPKCPSSGPSARAARKRPSSGGISTSPAAVCRPSRARSRTPRSCSSATASRRPSTAGTTSRART